MLNQLIRTLMKDNIFSEKDLHPIEDRVEFQKCREEFSMDNYYRT